MIYGSGESVWLRAENLEQAMARLTEVIRRKHLALSTEQSYCGWLKRYGDCVKRFPVHLSSDQKLEEFLTVLAREDVAASKQNQAFNVALFFYKETLGVTLKGVLALRAKRPAQVRPLHAGPAKIPVQSTRPTRVISTSSPGGFNSPRGKTLGRTG